MGVLDFFFGRTKATPTTTTTIQSSKLPEEIAPYVKDVLAEAQRLYDEGKERGYEEYPGMTIAPRTPAEEEAIAGLRGLIGTQDTYLQEAESALRGIPQEFTTEQAEKFMSPYQQAVIDIEKRKAEEDFQRKVMPEFERQAVQAGGMSGLGSRAGVQAAILGSEFSKQLGDIQSKGQQKAYEDAYKRFQDQMAMDRARAADLQGMGLTKFQTGLAEQGLAQQLAQADRQEMQATLDEQYAKYLEREQYPKKELAQLSSFVYGNPFLETPDRTFSQQSMLQPTSSIGQGLLGLGLTGLNVYGMGGGFSPGGQFSFRGAMNNIFGPRKKAGGRIVYKQEGGELPNVYSQNQVTARPVGGGLGGFFGDVFNRYPRSNPRSNVIENIDNAAGSLSNYKEIMDENMENLRRASAGISRTYNETFGPMSGRGLGTLTPFVNRAMAQNPGLEQRVNTYGMKDGGGLGGLPVINRRGAGSIDPRVFYSDNERDTTNEVPRSPVTLNRYGQSSLLDTLKQIEGAYPEFSKLLSGEIAKEDAAERSALRKTQMERLKAAMPQQQRFTGLAEAAKRVMGADPSKGFINALVEGMSGLDEVQREAYLKQKEQELKLLELELEGEESDLKAKQEARKEAATLPLKLAQLSKALKGTYRNFDPTVQKTLQDAAEKELGLQAQIIDGQVVSIKNKDGKDATDDELRAFNRLFSKLVTGFARFDKASDSAAEALSQTLRLIPGLKIPKPIPSSGQGDTDRTPLPATTSKRVKNSQNLVTSGS